MRKNTPSKNREKIMKRKEKQKELLKMSPDRAYNILRREILFKLVQEAGRDNCYRCNSKILDYRSLSIEHKKQWTEAIDPKEAYFNQENIAFSHLSCNIRNEGKSRFINLKNKTGYRGVSRTNNPNLPFKATIKYNKEQHFLYTFKTPESAARCYDFFSELLFGVDALTNVKLGLLAPLNNTEKSHFFILFNKKIDVLKEKGVLKC